MFILSHTICTVITSKFLLSAHISHPTLFTFYPILHLHLIYNKCLMLNKCMTKFLIPFTWSWWPWILNEIKQKKMFLFFSQFQLKQFRLGVDKDLDLTTIWFYKQLQRNKRGTVEVACVYIVMTYKAFGLLNPGCLSDFLFSYRFLYVCSSPAILTSLCFPISESLDCRAFFFKYPHPEYSEGLPLNFIYISTQKAHFRKNVSN